MQPITAIEDLEALYGGPVEAALVKEVPQLTSGYRALIAASPFCILATAGPEGLDCSPRGDRPGFVRVVDDKTLILPDRRGNNRVDSLRNIVRDPRIALLFLIPGAGVTLRVNGRAYVTADADLLDSFAVDGKTPRSAIVIEITETYFQCARAIMRSQLWEPASRIELDAIPSAGEMLAGASAGRVGGAPYDAAWSRRARDTMW